MDITWPGIENKTGDLSGVVPAGKYRVMIESVDKRTASLSGDSEFSQGLNGCIQWSLRYKILPGEPHEGSAIWDHFKMPFVEEENENGETVAVYKEEIQGPTFERYLDRLMNSIAKLYIVTGNKLEMSTFNLRQLQGETLRVDVSKKSRKDDPNKYQNDIIDYLPDSEDTIDDPEEDWEQ